MKRKECKTTTCCGTAWGKSQLCALCLEAKCERLENAHKRNIRSADRIPYEQRGHRCDWRALAEAMVQRSKAALEGKQDG